MRNNWIRIALFAAVLGLQVLPAAARADVLKGKLVELSSVDNMIKIQPAGAPPEKAAAYKVASDARWHICLQDACLVRKGVEGFRTINEYAEFGAYGIPLKSYDVTLDVAGDVAKALEVQIVTKVH